MMADGQRSEAAYQRLSAELGRIYGELVAAQEALRAHEQTIEGLRRDLAQQAVVQKEG